jgi:hypothetical protein
MAESVLEDRNDTGSQKGQTREQAMKYFHKMGISLKNALDQNHFAIRSFFKIRVTIQK